MHLLNTFFSRRYRSSLDVDDRDRDQMEKKVGNKREVLHERGRGGEDDNNNNYKNKNNKDNVDNAESDRDVDVDVDVDDDWKKEESIISADSEDDEEEDADANELIDETTMEVLIPVHSVTASSVHSAVHPTVLAEIYNARQASYVLPALAMCRAAYTSMSRLRGVPGNCIVGDGDEVSNSRLYKNNSNNIGEIEIGAGIGMCMEEWEIHALQQEKEEAIATSHCLSACTDAMDAIEKVDQSWMTRSLVRLSCMNLSQR